MRSSFFEFNVAISGLFTARANLDVVGHNIANAAVPGYSRQYAEQRANKPLTFFNGRGMIGTGSEVYGVGQMRDFYLDKKYWSERGVLGEYTVKRTQLDIMESVLNPLSGSSITDTFNTFFDRLQTLNDSAGDPTYRNNVIQSAQGLVSFISQTATSIKKQQSDINTEIRTTVEIINSLGQQICSLNQQISVYEQDGSRANDLRDQRTRLVDELSLYVNVEVRETEKNADYAAGMYPDPEDRGKSDKRFSVLINGYNFINHYDVVTLTVRERTSNEKRNEMDVDGLYDIYFTNGNKFDMYSSRLQGELKGLIDTRDGTNGVINPSSPLLPQPPQPPLTPQELSEIGVSSYKGLPYYMEKLNELVRTFAKAINEGVDRNDVAIPEVTGHIKGYDSYGNTGNYFFTYDKAIKTGTSGSMNYNRMNVENFILNPDLLTDPKLLAAAETKPVDESDNRVIHGFLKIKDYTSLFKEGKILDFVVGMTVELGIDVKQASNFSDNYTDVTTTIDNQRIAVSGVDINEEMVNMMKYQHLYQAAAKLVNIIDSIYDTTVNRLGNW